MGRYKVVYNMTDNSIPLKEYFDTRLNSIDKALGLASAQMEKRLEGMNEFRDALKDQAGRFITRAELEAYLDKINFNIKSLELSKATLEGKASQQSVILTALLSLCSLILGIIGVFTK
jgi:hypothetical protein